MNTNEAVAIFKALGWVAKINVDRYAEKKIGDRIVVLGFRFKDLSIYQTFESTPSIKSTHFTNAVKKIEGGRREFNDILKAEFKGRTRLKKDEISEQDIELVCRKAIEWAKSFNIDLRYKELCQLDPSTPGAAGVWHLASLAILGEVERLKFYQASFETGDRLGFVNYITKDYIDRAVALAEGKINF